MDFNRTQDKLDQIETRLASIDTTLAVNTQLLAEHIKRTALLEEALKPVQEHVSNIKFLGKTVAWVIGSGGILSIAFWILLRQRL